MYGLSVKVRGTHGLSTGSISPSARVVRWSHSQTVSAVLLPVMKLGRMRPWTPGVAAECRPLGPKRQVDQIDVPGCPRHFCKASFIAQRRVCAILTEGGRSCTCRGSRIRYYQRHSRYRPLKHDARHHSLQSWLWRKGTGCSIVPGFNGYAANL